MKKLVIEIDCKKDVCGLCQSRVYDPNRKTKCGVFNVYLEDKMWAEKSADGEIHDVRTELRCQQCKDAEVK